jgi:hypothetical protein
MQVRVGAVAVIGGGVRRPGRNVIEAGGDHVARRHPFLAAPDARLREALQLLKRAFDRPAMRRN